MKVFENYEQDDFFFGKFEFRRVYNNLGIHYSVSIVLSIFTIHFCPNQKRIKFAENKY